MWIRKRDAIVLLCLLLCLAGVALSQNGEFLQSPTPANPNGAKAQYAPLAPRIAQIVEPRLPKIPNLVGLTLLEARKMVSDRFTLAVVDRRPGTSQDVVVRQSPSEGTLAKPGATIQIWLSEPSSSPSRQPPALVPVPALVGHTRDSAIQLLRDTHFPQGEITSKESEDVNDIVLSQDPAPPTRVPPNTPVSFVVSRQIQHTLTLSGPSSGKPGDSLTFAAHLDPYVPSTQYQFTFGPGQSSAWGSNPVITHTFDSDGNYDVSAIAAWDGGKASYTFPVTIHAPEEYDLRLTPSPLQQTEGNPVEFRAELKPPVENAVYTFDFNDPPTKLETSSSPVVSHVYQLHGAYRPIVSVLIPDHNHRIPGSPTLVTILARPPSPIDVTGHWLNESKVWIIGGIALLLGGFLLGKLRPNGSRKLRRANIKLKTNIPPGTLTIRVQGRLWSRIEDLRAKNGRDHTY